MKLFENEDKNEKNQVEFLQQEIINDFKKKLKLFEEKAKSDVYIENDASESEEDEESEEDDFFYGENFFDDFGQSEEKFEKESKKNINRLARMYLKPQVSSFGEEENENNFPLCSFSDDFEYSIIL